jgi:hypothetical protein
MAQSAAPVADPPAAGGTLESARDSRTVLVLRIEGPLDPERESALTGLLSSQLSPSHVTLTVERSSLPFLGWTAHARKDPRALVLAILDVRPSDGWAVYVVDAARGRAILRRLAGAETNAAALEEVSAILTSAVAAVREGLEVASKPVAAVVGGDEPTRAAPSAPPSRSPPPPPPDDAASAPSPHDAAAPHEQNSFFFAGVYGRSATLARSVVPGLEGEVGLELPFALRLSLGAAYDFPATRTTELGSFELRRFVSALRVGRTIGLGPVLFEPRAGSGVEVVRRSDTTPVEGAVAGPDRTHARASAFLGALLRYPLVNDALSFAVGIDGSYAPQPLHFTESGGRRIASAGSFGLSARAGLEVAP